MKVGKLLHNEIATNKGQKVEEEEKKMFQLSTFSSQFFAIIKIISRLIISTD